jgi:hypothetical protein
MKKYKMKLTVQLLALVFIVTPLISFPVLAVAGEAGSDKVPASVTVPAGTYLMVKLDSALNSKQHKAGHKFTATLEGDIVVNNTVVAPRGSKVYGQLTESKKSGRLAGKSEMQITLTQILINNQLKPIVTSGVKAVTDNTAKNTVGKTARFAAIGALADGKKGARTGAKVGAGVSVLTRGNQINIPAGTLLDFTLGAPLTP